MPNGAAESPRPARIAAGLAQVGFHVIQTLLQLRNFLLLGVYLRHQGIDVRASVLLHHGFLRVWVILDERLFLLALQDVQLFFCFGDLVVLLLESLSPSLLAVRIFFSLVGCRLLAGRSGRGRRSGWCCRGF